MPLGPSWHSLMAGMCVLLAGFPGRQAVIDALRHGHCRVPPLAGPASGSHPLCELRPAVKKTPMMGPRYTAVITNIQQGLINFLSCALCRRRNSPRTSCTKSLRLLPQCQRKIHMNFSYSLLFCIFVSIISIINGNCMLHIGVFTVDE